jgi:hypothetical protein
MSVDWPRDPEPSEIALMCAAFKAHWTEQEERQRLGRMPDSEREEWSIRQFYVHHHESGKWPRGYSRMAEVWRCVDGR